MKKKSGSVWRTALVFVVCLGGFGLVVWLFVRPSGPQVEVIEGQVAGGPGQAVYTGNVVDTLVTPDVVAEAGRRYRVRIEGSARDSASGVARIGGLITFVPGVASGDVCIIEVCRIKGSVAEAGLVKMGRKAPVSVPTEISAPVKPVRPPRPTPAASGAMTAGAVHEGVIEDIGSKGDGIVRLDGKVVFVPNTVKGQRIRFRIVEDKDRFAIGGQVAGDVTPVEAPAAAPQIADQKSDAADTVVEGSEHIVEITEQDRRNPETGGVARIGGLVTFVMGTQPGDRVRIRITERAPRFARAEVIEVLGAGD